MSSLRLLLLVGLAMLIYDLGAGLASVAQSSTRDNQFLAAPAGFASDNNSVATGIFDKPPAGVAYIRTSSRVMKADEAIGELVDKIEIWRERGLGKRILSISPATMGGVDGSVVVGVLVYYEYE